MRRRELIKLTVGLTAAWPGIALAQSNKIFRIGVIGPALNSPATIPLYQAFLAQLRSFGFNEGQNLVITYAKLDEPHGMYTVAAEMVRSQADLIVASGPEVALQAVLAASRTIPIVVIAVNFDPLARGYIKSLARPGGSVTGVVFQQLELAQKQVELLAQSFPGRTRLASLYDEQTIDQFIAAQRSAKALNLDVQGHKLEKPPYDFASVFRAMIAGAAEMVLVQSSPHFIPHQMRISELAIANRLPTMFLTKTYVHVGGLMSYSADFPVMWRRSADYVAKILKGARPADLPVEQATKFEMVINLKTAKAIGVELPTAILLRADEVIE
jgi:putative tryptophan/tyrosine transport system substrate-binding protein